MTSVMHTRRRTANERAHDTSHPCRAGGPSSGIEAGRRAGARLVLLALLLALALGRLGADLLVVLLEGRKVLAGLGELALLHALADVPVDERTLGVHEVELVVDARVELGDGGR